MSGLAYRPEIDGLRAIAVAAVVLYHADSSLLPGGFVGVDVFFVISGYLITALLAREWRLTGRIDLPAFYARRIRRLLPALILVVVATLGLSVWLLGPLGSPLHRVTDSALASLLFVANIHFQFNSGGYFNGPSDEIVLLHLWSLAVEEQYYLVYPALLWCLFAKAPRRLTWVLAGLSLMSLLLAEHWLQLDRAAAFYQMPARFWELAVGALVAMAPTSRLAGSRPAWMASAGLAAIGSACVFITADGHFPGVGAALPVLGALLVLWAIHDSSQLGWPGAMLRSRPFVRLGLLSYSLYLWHWPLLALDRAVNLDHSAVSWRLGLCLLALGLAWLTYRFVESPLRRGGRLSSPGVLLRGLLATTAALGITTVVGRMNLVPEEIDALVKRTSADRPLNMNACHFGLRAEVSALKPVECDSRPGGTPRVAVWGDSHALAWQPFAWKLAESRGVSATSMTMDACPPVKDYAGHRADIPRHGENCAKFNALALDRLSRPGAFDLVFIGKRWPLTFERPSTEGGGSTLDVESQSLLGSVDAALMDLESVPQVVLILPLPLLRHDASRCIAAGREHECSFTRAQFDQAAKPWREGLVELARRHPNVTLVDPADFFCGPQRCPVTRDGYSLFWDDDHVSSTAARAFADAYLADPARYTLPPE